MTPDDIDWYSTDIATFGDRLAAAREAIALSQSELAHRLGVRVETLRAWEDDRSEPRANRLQMLSGVLNVSLRWLLTGDGEGVSPPSEDSMQEIRRLAKEMRVIRSDLTRSCERLLQIERRIETLLDATP